MTASAGMTLFIGFVCCQSVFRMVMALSEMHFVPSYPRWETGPSKNQLLFRAAVSGFVSLWAAWLLL